MLTSTFDRLGFAPDMFRFLTLGHIGKHIILNKLKKIQKNCFCFPLPISTFPQGRGPFYTCHCKYCRKLSGLCHHCEESRYEVCGQKKKVLDVILERKCDGFSLGQTKLTVYTSVRIKPVTVERVSTVPSSLCTF